jgi:hypothetical protein
MKFCVPLNVLPFMIIVTPNHISEHSVNSHICKKRDNDKTMALTNCYHRSYRQREKNFETIEKR